MASIQKYQTKDGKTRYSIRWRDGNKNKSKSFDRYQNAKDFLTSLEHALREGSYVAPTKTTVKAYLKDWIKAQENRLASNTIRGYKKNIEHLNEIADITIQRLSPSDIEKAYNKLREDLSGTTLLYIHRVLSKALRDAKKQRMINNNPCEYVTTPKKNSYTAEFIHPDDVKAYVRAFENTAYFTPVVIAVFCGLRRNEILALTWDKIDFKNKLINVDSSILWNKGKYSFAETKGKEKRKVYMNDDLVTILKTHKETQKQRNKEFEDKYFESDFVNTYENGKLIKPNTLSKAFNGRLERAGLKHIEFHALRHTNASLLIYEGNDLKTVSDWLGHSTIKITADIYGHVIEEAKKKAANSLEKYF